jgi:hypothetical protein
MPPGSVSIPGVTVYSRCSPARAVRRHRLDHPQREDPEPSLVHACRRGGERAAQQPQRLHEPRGEARGDHAERHQRRVLELRDHQVLERVREEHPGVVPLELVRRPLEMHEGVVGKVSEHAREQTRRGRGAGMATPDDHDVDPQRLARELELGDALVPAPGEDVLQQRDEQWVPRGVDPHTPGPPPAQPLRLRRRARDPHHRQARSAAHAAAGSGRRSSGLGERSPGLMRVHRQQPGVSCVRSRRPRSFVRGARAR